MSEPGSDRWDVSDAWLLASIAIAPTEHEDGATLAAVLMTAEGINHATSTPGETELAIRRLLGAGLIVVDQSADHFRLTEAGQQVRSRWRHGAFGWIEALPPALRRHGSPVAAEWSLAPGAYEQAYRQAMQVYENLAKRSRPRRRSSSG
jgi:hypothetical protein